MFFNDEKLLTEDQEFFIQESTKFTLKSTDLILGNLIKKSFSTKDAKYLEKLRPNLLKMVKRASTKEQIKYLQNDANMAKRTLTKRKENKSNEVANIDSHIEWIDTVYRPALSARMKELA